MSDVTKRALEVARLAESSGSFTDEHRWIRAEGIADTIYEVVDEIERLREYISKQALDIVTLGQELGRLREALEDHIRAAECIRHWHDTLNDEGMVVSAEHVRLLWEATIRARAALAEQEPK